MKTAVVHAVHSISIRIISWMLREIGYEVFVAGPSFRQFLPGYTNAGPTPDICRGGIDFAKMPKDALFVDTHPEAEKVLRQRGWNGPILMIWQMPVGPEWVRANFRPGRRVGSLGWSTSVGRAIKEMALCPNDHFWPPYYGPLDQSPRGSIGKNLITVIENACGWSNVGVLEQLRDDPEARLELYGGGPPPWALRIPQVELFAKMRESLAMYHPKPFDTPGLDVMEAALQAVPIIFCPDWMRPTEATDVFEPGVSCLVAETQKMAVLDAAKRLRDPDENRRIGLEGRRRLLIAADWPLNRPRFSKLVDEIIAS